MILTPRRLRCSYPPPDASACSSAAAQRSIHCRITRPGTHVARMRHPRRMPSSQLQKRQIADTPSREMTSRSSAWSAWWRSAKGRQRGLRLWRAILQVDAVPTDRSRRPACIMHPLLRAAPGLARKPPRHGPRRWPRGARLTGLAGTHSFTVSGKATALARLPTGQALPDQPQDHTHLRGSAHSPHSDPASTDRRRQRQPCPYRRSARARSGPFPPSSKRTPVAAEQAEHQASPPRASVSGPHSQPRRKSSRTELDDLYPSRGHRGHS